MQELIAYVKPHGPLPEVAGTKRGDLLIMGTAACLWDDLKAFNHLHTGDRMAVNMAALFYNNYFSGPVEHVTTMHPEFLPLLFFNQKFRHHTIQGHLPLIHTHRVLHRFAGIDVQAPDCIWNLENHGHTSGLFAVHVGMLMGYERIILAGSPVDASPNFYAPAWTEDGYGSPTAQNYWQTAVPHLKGRVFSLSGNTRQWLGAP